MGHRRSAFSDSLSHIRLSLPFPVNDEELMRGRQAFTAETAVLRVGKVWRFDIAK